MELIGYEETLDTLINNYKSNNLHTSSIFYGSKGIGKRTFVNKLICEVFKSKLDKNNYSHHINLFKNNTHPNIKILEKQVDQKSKKLKTYITIEQIRNLKKFINSSSAIKDISKIIIIDCADDLNVNSANSLLKNLEEPKSNTFFFLISHQLSSLLPTIRSRCLKIKLNNHDYTNFKSILEAHIDIIDEDEIKLLYDLTYGSPGDAISFYADNIIDLFELTINSLQYNIINASNIKLVDLLSKFEDDKFKIYLSILKSILITMNKEKNNNFKSNVYISEKYKSIKDISKSLTKNNIIDRFEYLTKNESDLFTYNLDKKIFMLNFLTC